MKKPENPQQRTAVRKITLSRETLRQLEERELQEAAGQKKVTGPTCSGWPPCTC